MKPGTRLKSAADDTEVGVIFFAPDGGFYVADFGNFRVQQFDKDRNFVRSIGAQGTGDGQFLGPVGMALDAQGKSEEAAAVRARYEKAWAGKSAAQSFATALRH